MSVTYSFCDDAAYTAADVNQITKRLVTRGIADPFEDGVPYNLSALNAMGALVYSEGVVPETDVSLKVIPGKDGTVQILPGTAFFGDGAVITVESGGHALTPTPGEKNYVYLKNDLINTNACYPAVSTTEPEGDIVMLCEISETGEITDKRNYARGKLPGYASNACHTMKIEDSVSVVSGEAEEKVYRLGNHTFRFLLAVQEGFESDFKRYNYCIGLVNLADGSVISCDYADEGTNGLSVEHLTVYRQGIHHAWAFPEMISQDGEQCLKLVFSYFSFGEKDVEAFPITLYLF